MIWLLFSIACLYQLATCYLVRRFHRFEMEPPCASRPSYPVSQLKPVRGVHPDSEANFRSYLEQDYDGPLETIFSAGRVADPALASIPRSMGVKVIEGDVSGRGGNPKIASLLQAYPLSIHPFVVCSDSDMRVGPEFLNQVMGHFDDERVGMVTSLYSIRQVHSPEVALEGFSLVDFAASVLVARALEGITFGLGATMAFRRGALEQIGGLDGVADYLADDYQLGNRLYRAGWKVKLAGVVVEDALSALSFRDYFSHQLRWMRTYRISRRGGHFAFIVTQGSAWVLALLCINGLCWSSLGATALWWQIRSRCTLANWRLLGGQKVDRWLPWLPVKDLLYLVLWSLSLVGDTVSWGALDLKIRADGRIVKPVPK